MSLKKILMKGTTRISLHERFTYLRKQSGTGGESSPTVTVQTVHQGLFSGQPASATNRRLAESMDRRPTVMAALKLKKRILRQRLGQARPGSVKDRLSLRGRGARGQRGMSLGRSPLLQQSRPRGSRGNRRAGSRGSLSRSHSGNLSRSQSMQSLNGRRNFSNGGGRFQNRNTFNRQEFRRGRGRGFRSRGGYNRSRDDFRGRRGGAPTGGRFISRGSRSRGFRMRGGGRGRGGRGARGPVPTKEELDSQLDQYMAGSRSILDRELDTYMTEQESWE